MKKTLLLLFLLGLTACGNTNHAELLNATNNADCVAQCADLMYKNYCDSAFPSYTSSLIDNTPGPSECNCATLGCWR